MGEMFNGTITNLNQGFDELWVNNLGCYDGVEIHGVINLYDFADIDILGTCCEIDDEANPPHFYGVYAHLKEDGIECIGDFTRYKDAKAYADKAISLIKSEIIVDTL